MEQTFVFVYAKDGKIKALNIEEAKRLQDELVKEGWVHTQTLDACVYIQYLHNDCEAVDLIDEMKSLTKRLNISANSCICESYLVLSEFQKATTEKKTI